MNIKWNIALQTISASSIMGILTWLMNTIDPTFIPDLQAKGYPAWAIFAAVGLFLAVQVITSLTAHRYNTDGKPQAVAHDPRR